LAKLSPSRYYRNAKMPLLLDVVVEHFIESLFTLDMSCEARDTLCNLRLSETNSCMEQENKVAAYKDIKIGSNKEEKCAKLEGRN
jgi:hypothetical protein